MGCRSRCRLLPLLRSTCSSYQLALKYSLVNALPPIPEEPLGMLTAAGAVAAGIVFSQVRGSPVVPKSSRPRVSRPNSCVISHVLASCHSCVEYDLTVRSGVQLTPLRST